MAFSTKRYGTIWDEINPYNIRVIIYLIVFALVAFMTIRVVFPRRSKESPSLSEELIEKPVETNILGSIATIVLSKIEDAETNKKLPSLSIGAGRKLKVLIPYFMDSAVDIIDETLDRTVRVSMNKKNSRYEIEILELETETIYLSLDESDILEQEIEKAFALEG